MNPYEIDVMKLTPEDYLKMRDRCRELEDKKKQQADCILKLETELSQFRVAMKESSEKIEALNDSIDQLNKALADKDKVTKYWADEAHRAKKRIEAALKDASEMIYNGESNASEAALKDADAKIQSANDRAANAKKEAKEAKERAESASERVRYLERKLRDVESLNDSLMKEMARRQGGQAEIREHDADIYQLDVLKYAPDYQHYKLNVLYAAIGMCGEAGEVSELVKKYEYHGHAMDTEHLARELGDVLWYVSYMANLFGYSLGKIMEMNQEKLAKRYPDGKFDAERSRTRKEGDI